MNDFEVEGLKEHPQPRSCVNCGIAIPEGAAIVRGPNYFCNLECVAVHHQAEFQQTARRLRAAATN